MIKIYHNPRCRKSREGIQILENAQVDFEVIEYLKNPLTHKELSDIMELLKIHPEELIRKNETIWKEDFKGKKLSDKELIQTMVDNPKLIERPIVINNQKAIIGRPPENIKSIL